GQVPATPGLAQIRRRHRHLVGRSQGRTDDRSQEGRGAEVTAPRTPSHSLSAPGGGEGWGEVGDSRAPADAHLTLPRLRRGPLPLPPEGRRGVICGYGIAMTGIVIAAVLGYLLGSIPFGLVLTRLAGLGDIRRI